MSTSNLMKMFSSQQSMPQPPPQPQPGIGLSMPGGMNSLGSYMQQQFGGMSTPQPMVSQPQTPQMSMPMTNGMGQLSFNPMAGVQGMPQMMKTTTPGFPTQPSNFDLFQQQQQMQQQLQQYNQQQQQINHLNSLQQAHHQQQQQLQAQLQAQHQVAQNLAAAVQAQTQAMAAQTQPPMPPNLSREPSSGFKATKKPLTNGPVLIAPPPMTNPMQMQQPSPQGQPQPYMTQQPAPSIPAPIVSRPAPMQAAKPMFSLPDINQTSFANIAAPLQQPSTQQARPVTPQPPPSMTAQAGNTVIPTNGNPINVNANQKGAQSPPAMGSPLHGPQDAKRNIVLPVHIVSPPKPDGNS
jgi:hypothetical protein